MSRATTSKKAKNAKNASEPAVSIRDRLIAAVLELSKTMSLHEMSQARVAAAAGVRQSHLTYYFPTRVDLVKAAVQAMQAEMMQATRMLTLMDGGQGIAVEAVRNFIATKVCELPTARMMLSLMLAADEDPSLRPWLEELDRESIAQLRNVLVMLGLDASVEDVELFQITFVGAVLHGTQLGSEAALRRAANVTLAAFDRLVQTAKVISTPAEENTSA
ncbi:MAG TPA: hypothetical protein VFM46_14050 [Pseudomonadales bacterium]|nr:hypothetical protein [Pseudomonadales bacterium]